MPSQTIQAGDDANKVIEHDTLDPAWAAMRKHQAAA